MIFERIDRTQSPLEVRFLEDCATIGLLVEPQFKVERIHADFGITGAKVVIECDSQQWHSSKAADVSDGQRNDVYARNGYAIVRLFGKEIYASGEQIAQEIKDWIQTEKFIPGYVYYPVAQGIEVKVIEAKGGFEGLEMP